MRIPNKILVGAALLGALLGSTAANAAILYSNGSANGTGGGLHIAEGFQAADSFTLSSPSTLAGVDMTLWNFPGDTTTAVDWAILNGEPGPGSVLDSGTAAVATGSTITNPNGFTVASDSFALPSISLAAGTYWLELQNAAVTNGDDALWDINGGPSSAWESTDGDIGTGFSETFDVTGTVVPTPEPPTLTLFAAGLAGLGAVRRRRKIAR